MFSIVVAVICNVMLFLSKNATVQSISGTGALTIGAAFLVKD